MALFIVLAPLTIALSWAGFQALPAALSQLGAAE